MEVSNQNQTAFLANNVVNLQFRQNKSTSLLSTFSANLTNYSYNRPSHREQKTALRSEFSFLAGDVK